MNTPLISLSAPALPHTLRMVLIKPSKFDDDGYVIRHWRGTLPSNTLAALNGLIQNINDRRELGDGVELVTELWDDTIQRIFPKRIVRANEEEGVKTVVCFCGVQSNQYPRASDLAKEFRALGVDVIIGGFHVSGAMVMTDAVPPEIQELMDIGVTMVMGEVENSLGDILRDAHRGEMKPLYNFIGDKPDLAEQPIPMMPQQYRKKFTASHMATIDTSRGCPFTCSFCTVINVQGRKMRCRNPERIADTIRTNWEEGVTHYFFVDDNLARNQRWEELFDLMIKMREDEGIKLTFMMQVDTQSHRIPRFIDKARAAGCTQVFLGVESLNPDSLKDAGKGQNKTDQYSTLIEAWREAQIATHTAYIIGFDHDTKDLVLNRDLKILIDELRPDQASFFMLTPLPGSEDHLNWLRSGREIDTDLNRYDSFHASMPHPRMTTEDWEGTYREAWKMFYSFDNMKSILERSNDRNYFNIMKNFIWYKNAMIEGEHPMITGFFRKRYRRDRRSGMPLESRWAFGKRRTKEVAHTLKEWVKLYWEMQELWLATWPQRDQRVQLAKDYVIRWKDVGKSLLSPFQWPRVPTLMAMRISLMKRRQLIGRSGSEVVNLVRRRAHHSRRMLNLYWRQTIHRFRTGQWHKIDVGRTLLNGYRELKVNLFFLAHLVKSKDFDKVGAMV